MSWQEHSTLFSNAYNDSPCETVADVLGWEDPATLYEYDNVAAQLVAESMGLA